MIECGERVAKCVSHHVFNTLNGCQQKRQSFAKFCKKEFAWHSIAINTHLNQTLTHKL